MNKRLFEFAKELNLPSKDILERCKKLGFVVPSQLTLVDDKIQSEIRKDLGLADLVAIAPEEIAPAPSAPAKSFSNSTAPTFSQTPSVRPTMKSFAQPATAATATYPAPKTIAPRKVPAGARPPMPSKTGGHGMAANRRKNAASALAKPELTVEEKLKALEGNTEGSGEPKVLTKIKISEGITVAELAQKLNVKPGVLIKEMFDLKILATINQRLDMTVAETLAGAHDAEVEVVPLFGSEILEEEADDPKTLIARPPVVTIMAHLTH